MTVRIYQITRAAPGASHDLLIVQGRGPGDVPDDTIEVIESPGLRTRPVVRASTEAVVLELENGDRFAFVIDKHKDAGAVPTEAGETQLRGCAKPAAVVRLRASGAIQVVAAPGQHVELTVSDGGHVVLNGGSLDVARATDPVTPSAGLLATLSAIVGVLNAPAGPVVSAPGTVPPFTGSIGTIASGNTTVKA